MASSEAGPSLPTNVPRFIDAGHIELVQVIGTGAYGVVWLGVDSRYGVTVYRAIKALRRTGLDARQRHFQRRELALHRLASRHSSVIAMDRIVHEGDNSYVVMDYGEDGDLFGMICDRKRYVGDDELIRSVFLQLLDGVAHIHSLHISHRDIKPENIVCSNDGTRVRICDFGLATSDEVSGEFGCGSTFYIAPECLGEWFKDANQYLTQPGDVWSLGVILVNLVCGRNPWRIASPSDESFNAFLRDPLFLRRILPISLECLELLTAIFTLHPADRVSLPELRRRVLKVRSFSMSEGEVIAAHAAATAKQAPAQVAPSAVKADLVPAAAAAVGTHAHAHTHASIKVRVEVPEAVYEQHRSEWEEDDVDDAEEAVFAFDDDLDMDMDMSDDDDDTPSLRADTGSPSPPTDRSRSTSSMGASLPPTPLMGAEDALRVTVGGVPVGVAVVAQGGVGVRVGVVPDPLQPATDKMWDMFNSHHQKQHPTSSLRSPEIVSPGTPNPFFQ